MARPTVITWIVLSVAAAMFAGCSMQYNGAFGFGKKDQEQVDSYRQDLQQRDLAVHPVQQGPMAGAQPMAAQNWSRQASAPAMRADASPSVYGGLPQPVAQTAGAASRDASSGFQRITFANEGADFDPAVDPTGKWLVFASTRHRKTADLYMKRIGDSAVTQLTDDPSNDVMPAISPDGKQIAFASDRSGNWDVYVMNVDGGQAMQLTNDPAHEIHPSFSPDGKWLVYCRYGDQSGQWEMVVIELANPSTKRFIGYGLFPSWSPVDNHIVFQRARERGTRWFSVWTIELVNGEAMRPTEIAASSNAAVITPSWSPDGQFIVFCTVVDDGNGGMPTTGNNSSDDPRQADIWMVDIHGRNRINLTQSQFSNLQPIWGADGTVYFTSNRSLAQGENIWSLRPDRALAVARNAAESTGAKPQAVASVPTSPGQ